MPLLDASAILAYLHGEPGWQAVEPAILDGSAYASPVNVAEVLGKLIDRGVPPDDAQASLAILDLKPLPFAAQEATETARLRAQTRSRGLSLGDRACLATARLHGMAVVTADRVWLDLADSLRLDIQCIRPDASASH
ncbi:type II toxin-antitoxin system VapC family toxin [Azospira restricta]|uniref:Type II toxin-antitoxin system VapC family toxin n=1 Tax=Azospira restricta TaxID=404405 RepID=A0A974SM46_9RHOO|nr:type II toxin-antitoxin system VapC family toxin [Azospira restricta]QRJ62741.1 type II toxin-antitoxin system VapC family toxin [Azospira restricta]